MPPESQPVVIRTDQSADGWWVKQVNANLNESFRVINSASSISRTPLFSDEELNTLPYRQQFRPNVTMSWPAPSPPPLSPSSSYPLPIVVNSVDITRKVLCNEIREMEDGHNKEMAAVQKNMDEVRKKVTGLLKVNKALAAYQAANFP